MSDKVKVIVTKKIEIKSQFTLSDLQEMVDEAWALGIPGNTVAKDCDTGFFVKEFQFTYTFDNTPQDSV